jgi:pyridoxamine 5'-phosphate oxidase
MTDTRPESEPLDRFRGWLAEAEATELCEPHAVTLSTVDTRGHPSSRVVLLKHADERGFVFYTNLESRKGRELAGHPRAALCFYWDPLKKQVRVRGPVEQVSDEEADAYFASRTRESQLGAWASDQSRPLGSREALERRFAELSEEYPDVVPRPPHWSGFRVVPIEVELWQSAPHRLHVREQYAREGDGWRYTLLFP